MRLRQRATITSTHILALRSFIYTFRVASIGGVVRVSTMGEHLRLRQLAVTTLLYFLVLQFYIPTFREESTLYGYVTTFIEGIRRMLKLGGKAFGLRQLTGCLASVDGILRMLRWENICVWNISNIFPLHHIAAITPVLLIKHPRRNATLFTRSSHKECFRVFWKAECLSPLNGFKSSITGRAFPFLNNETHFHS